MQEAGMACSIGVEAEMLQERADKLEERVQELARRALAAQAADIEQDIAESTLIAGDGGIAHGLNEVRSGLSRVQDCCKQAAQ